MAKTISPEKSRKKRWEEFQCRSFHLPNADSAIADAPDEPPTGQPCAQANFVDYSRLRIRLRDMGLEFKAEYSQANVARIICKSARTVSEWTRKEMMPCHYSPTNRPYYAAQDLEDYFAACERRNRREK